MIPEEARFVCCSGFEAFGLFASFVDIRMGDPFWHVDRGIASGAWNGGSCGTTGTVLEGSQQAFDVRVGDRRLRNGGRRKTTLALRMGRGRVARVVATIVIDLASVTRAPSPCIVCVKVDELAFLSLTVVLGRVKLTFAGQIDTIRTSQRVRTSMTLAGSDLVLVWTSLKSTRLLMRDSLSSSELQ